MGKYSECIDSNNEVNLQCIHTYMSGYAGTVYCHNYNTIHVHIHAYSVRTFTLMGTLAKMSAKVVLLKLATHKVVLLKLAADTVFNTLGFKCTYMYIYTCVYSTARKAWYSTVCCIQQYKSNCYSDHINKLQ